jgi:hypothetical protein
VNEHLGGVLEMQASGRGNAGRTSCGPFAFAMDLGQRKSPSGASALRQSHTVREVSERSENTAAGLFQHPAKKCEILPADHHTYRFLPEQQHQFGTGVWHLLSPHDLIALFTGISKKRKMFLTPLVRPNGYPPRKRCCENCRIGLTRGNILRAYLCLRGLCDWFSHEDLQWSRS